MDRFRYAPALHVLILWCLAVAEPLLSLVGQQAGVLVSWGATGPEVVLLAVTLCLLLPLPLAVGAQLSRPGLIACLFTINLLIALRAFAGALPGPPMLPVAAAVLMGAGATWAYLRLSEIRVALLLLAPLVLWVPLQFLFLGPASSLVLPSKEAAHHGEVKNPIPIVMIVFDELPLTSLLSAGGTINQDRFPAFARLAAGSTWFRQATTVSDDTLKAVPALLTGRMPTRESLPTLEHHPRNLLTLLEGSYRVVALETHTRLASPSALRPTGVTGGWLSRASDLSILYAHLVLPQGLAELPEVRHSWAHFGDEEHQSQRKADVAAFASALQATQEPTLYFYHAMLPHYPYQYLPDGRVYDSGGEAIADGLIPGQLWGSPWSAHQAYQRHLLQLGYADTALGLVLDRLEANGLWKDALIVVTADHGVSYRTGIPMRQLVPENAADILPVPLFIKMPGSPPQVDERNVQTVDVLPTILAAVGYPNPPELDGESLLDSPDLPPVKTAISTVITSLEPQVFQFPYPLPGVSEAVERKLQIFGTTWDDLFRLGPAPELLGSEVPALPTAKGSALITHQALLERFDPEAEFLPSRIMGSLEVPSLHPPYPLGLALRGRIVATTIAMPELQGGAYFSAMVAPKDLEPGENPVRVVLVTPDGRPLAEVPVGQPETFQLKDRALVSEERRVPLDSSVEGAIETVKREGDAVLIQGWARGEGLRILIFSGDRQVAQTGTGWTRTDLVPALGEEANTAGISVQIPTALLPSDEDLRFFAVTPDGRATELPVERIPIPGP